MQVAPPIHPLQQVAEEVGDVADVQVRAVLGGGDAQVLGQRQLAVAQQGVGQGEQFPRPPRVLVGDVAFAADGQQQRMHPGRLDGVDRAAPRGSPAESPARPTRGSGGLNIASSCGGRPTTVNGQIASAR